MASQAEQDLTKIVASTIHITKYNEGENLPFQLVCAENDKITWTCGKDQQQKITQVYYFRGNENEEPEKKVGYLETEEDARRCRDTLMNAGWVKTNNPEARIRYPGMDPLTVGDVKLNRKQKRMFGKVMNNLSNPKNRNARKKDK